MGLVRMAFEASGFEVVFANDIDQKKHGIYSSNFGSSGYLLKDIRLLQGDRIPDIEIATASFPCTDLSLAGNRAGLHGEQSSLLIQFLRILEEMGPRRPELVFIENVLGFASSNKGEDVSTAISGLNALGFKCDVVVLDARRFVPQSRPRLYIVATVDDLLKYGEQESSELRPQWIETFAQTHPSLEMGGFPLPDPPADSGRILQDLIEDILPTESQWWDADRLAGFYLNMSPANSRRLENLQTSETVLYATAYRRTRHGKAVWEIRADHISGCLRTARGGSSKQAVVEAGQGNVRVRWMAAREYARLQGAPHFDWGNASESQAKFALGDAVCVPAVTWLAENYIAPLLSSTRQPMAARPVLANV
jgi:DNA (cytosine-5)-methyltransferase 1